jgi:hypothetical protein
VRECGPEASRGEVSRREVSRREVSRREALRRAASGGNAATGALAGTYVLLCPARLYRPRAL